MEGELGLEPQTDPVSGDNGAVRRHARGGPHHPHHGSGSLVQRPRLEPRVGSEETRPGWPSPPPPWVRAACPAALLGAEGGIPAPPGSVRGKEAAQPHPPPGRVKLAGLRLWRPAPRPRGNHREEGWDFCPVQPFLLRRPRPRLQPLLTEQPCQASCLTLTWEVSRPTWLRAPRGETELGEAGLGAHARPLRKQGPRSKPLPSSWAAPGHCGQSSMSRPKCWTRPDGRPDPGVDSERMRLDLSCSPPSQHHPPACTQ